MAEPFCIPASNERDFLLFLIPARIWCVSVLDFSHSNRCVMLYRGQFSAGSENLKCDYHLTHPGICAV